MSSLQHFNTEAGALQAAENFNISALLAANVPEFITVPVDDIGMYARIVTFQKTGDFFSQAFTAVEATDRALGGNFTSYVTNGTFASDTGWTKGTGWTIGTGVATATGAISTALTQSAATTLIAGQSYTVTYTATRSAGSVTVSLGGTAGTARSTAATFSEVIVAGSTQAITFTGAGFTGTLDNVFVTPWVYGTGWVDTTAGVATATTASATLAQTSQAAYQLKQGQAYYVSMTIVANAGSLTPSLGGTAGTARSVTGTYSEVIIAGSAQDITFTGSGFTGTVDTVTVVPCATVNADNTTGRASDLTPNGYYLNRNKTVISLCAAGSVIVNSRFFK